MSQTKYIVKRYSQFHPKDGWVRAHVGYSSKEIADNLIEKITKTALFQTKIVEVKDED